jgi:predicted Zn-dependent protease
VVALQWPATGAARTATQPRLEQETGDAWAELGNWRRAVEHYRKAVALEPGRHEARLKLAQGLRRTGDRKAALAELVSLARILPDSAAVASAEAVVRLELDDPERACQAFERALKAVPGHERSLYGRAECLLASPGAMAVVERRAEVERHLQAFLAIYPRGEHAQAARDALEKLRLGDAGARLQEAREALASGQAQRAMELARAVLAARPDLEPAHLLLGQCLMHPTLDRTEEALESFRRAPRIKEALLQLGISEYEAGELEEARRRLEAALALDDRYAEAYYHLGLVWLDLQTAPRADVLRARIEAQRAFERLMALSPDSPLARRASSKLQLLSGEVRGLDEGETLDGAKELELGRRLSAMLEEQWGRSVDTVLEDRLQDILLRLSKTMGGKANFPLLRVRVLELDAVNALALTGGTIYVNRGLVELVRDRLDDSDDVLAAVLAHELVHIQLRHGLGMLDLVGGAQGLLAAKSFDVQSLGSLVRGLSRKHEFEADQLGSLLAFRAGFDPAAAYRLHRLLHRAGLEVPEGLDHPTHAERADRLREYLLSLRARSRNFDRALEALERDRPEQAVLHLETFLAIFPDNQPARANLAVALHRLAAPDLLARLGFKLSTQVAPRHGLRPILLRTNPKPAAESRALARMREAALLLRGVVEAQPEDAGARTNLGASLLALGEFQAARSELEQARRLDPTGSGTQNDLAVGCLLSGRQAEGLRLLRTLVVERPDFSDARFNLARALASTGDHEAARAEYLAFLSLEGHTAWSDLARRHLAELAGDKAE